MRLKLLFSLGLATGYVLGAKVGRPVYERIKARASKTWEDPRVQKVVSDAGDLVSEAAEATADNAKVAAEKVTDAAAALKKRIQDAADAAAKKAGSSKVDSDSAAGHAPRADEALADEEVVTEAEPKPLP